MLKREWDGWWTDGGGGGGVLGVVCPGVRRRPGDL